MASSDLPDYAVRNRDHWTVANARYTAGRAAEAWAHDHVSWGVWHQPEEKIQALPDLRDRDVVELGCGTAYFLVPG
jgi:hypothetical protein